MSDLYADLPQIDLSTVSTNGMIVYKATDTVFDKAGAEQNDGRAFIYKTSSSYTIVCGSVSGRVAVYHSYNGGSSTSVVSTKRDGTDVYCYVSVIYNTPESNFQVPIVTSSMYPSLNAAINAIFAITPIVNYPIIYRLTNATTTGPNEAAVGDTVTVLLNFTEGYGVVNPSSDAYVTCNGVLVPSTYSNGQLVFTMPDPS